MIEYIRYNIKTIKGEHLLPSFFFMTNIHFDFSLAHATTELLPPKPLSNPQLPSW